MNRPRPLMRFFCLLLSLCVLTGSIGAPSAAWECHTSEATAPQPSSCCAEPVGCDVDAATGTDAAGCCTVKVAYDHVVTDSIGPVFTLAWPAPVVALPPAIASWRVEWRTAPAVSAAASRRLFGADSGPPNRAVGWALVVALHQLRN